MTDPWRPLCLDPGEVGSCRDCTVRFAEEMRAAGRCNGIPGELTAGIAGNEEDMDLDHPVTSAGRVPVATSTPCHGCAHAAVCRIRPSIERLAVEASLPRLEDGVAVSLSASVACDHFARASASRAAYPSRLSPEGYAAVVAANQARAERKRAEKASA